MTAMNTLVEDLKTINIFEMNDYSIEDQTPDREDVSCRVLKVTYLPTKKTTHFFPPTTMPIEEIALNIIGYFAEKRRGYEIIDTLLDKKISFFQRVFQWVPQYVRAPISSWRKKRAEHQLERYFQLERETRLDQLDKTVQSLYLLHSGGKPRTKSEDAHEEK